MIELKLECKKTQLRLKNAPEPLTEGLRNYAKIVFELGEDWAGKSITATFKRVIDQIPMSVTVSNGECVIPWEAFVYPVTEVSIRGTQGEEVITSSILRLEIKRSLNEGGAPLPPTEDLYDQILETAEAAETKADTVLQAYQSGELKGEKGDKGDPGQPGAKGDPGEQGEPGQAATVAVHSVVTGEPGTSAAVENMGTSSAASFKFTIPQGAKGDKGDKGDPGDGGVPGGGNPGQVLTKTESGVAWQDSEASGDYLPLTGGTVTGNVAVSTGTTEPNVTLKRTVDSAACELTARIDSEAKAGLRYKVGTDTVNELILEQNQTRFRKPLNTASGGVPITGITGQVLTKTADGHTWQDLPEIVEPTADELREILNTPVLQEINGKAVLKTPDASATAILDIASGGTGANNAADARSNLGITLENIGAAAETDLDNYLPLTGGTLRGSVTIGNAGESTYRDFKIRRKSTSSNLQRDAVFTTDGESTAIGLSGEPEQGESQTALNYLRLYPDRTEMTKALTISSGGTGANTAEQARENLGAASEDHTHNYAGSSSPGGAATSANKLATARTITLAGAVNGSATFDGSKNITITTTGDSEAAGFLAAHPVGAIYHTTVSDNPGTLYGGTWRALPSVEGFMWERTA